MSRYDVIVLGGGPAGMQAAITARRHGLHVAIVDEGRRPGGQIYRAPSDPVRPADLAANADLAHGERLRAALDASGADVLSRHRAWAAAPGMRVDCVAQSGPVSLEAAALILATGTTERVIPMPGLTLPGVIGLAAATILLKAHGVTPGGPTVVAGVGPLLYAVAAGIRKAGGHVAAIVDLLHPADWAAALPGLTGRPDLLARGVRWMAGLHAAGVPVHHRATVAMIQGEATVRAVEVASVAADWSVASGAPRRTIPAVSVAIGHGLAPATEFARLLGVPHHYDAARGGWVPDLSPDGRAADGVYIAGDCAGIAGAAAAEFAGILAGLSAARDLGALTSARYADLSGPVRLSLGRAQRFGQAISRLMALRPGLARSIAPGTIVCRCEDVPRAAIDGAVAAGVRHMNQLKSTTRCGMGPCQGRSCADAAAEIMAADAGVPREHVGLWTARAPLRPLPLEAALGSFSYADIPRPPLLPA
jgi:thioredoxin reductase/bacterioferritin-associated ferredoxin